MDVGGGLISNDWSHPASSFSSRRAAVSPPLGMARGDEFEFDKGEDVLAYHGPLIYEAQVRDRVLKNPLQGHATSKLKLYRIHYTNWNDHWDEWVAESRVLRVDEANKRLQQERIREFHRAFKRKSNHKTEVEAPKRQKSEEVPLQDVREALRLPHSMKLKLLEDWERITRERCARRDPASQVPSYVMRLQSQERQLVCCPHSLLCSFAQEACAVATFSVDF